MSNQSIVTEFLLLEFSEIRQLQILCSVAFSIIYLTTLIGNSLVIVVVAFNHTLHTPMYFFLANLSATDVGYISVTIPKAIANLLMDTWQISYPECVAQVFFFVFFGNSEFFLLTIMAYDRYVAICNPLQYEYLLNKKACIQMVASVWTVSLFHAVLHSSCTFAMTFCSNLINQFFCEIPPLLQLSCSDSYIIENRAISLAMLFSVGCLSFIIISYLKIFKAVLKISSAKGRKKATSTCFPHLLVLFLFFFTGSTAYLEPSTTISGKMSLVLSVMYSVIPPFMNPIIYSIKNKEIMSAVQSLWYKINFGAVFTDFVHQDSFFKKWKI